MLFNDYNSYIKNMHLLVNIFSFFCWRREQSLIYCKKTYTIKKYLCVKIIKINAFLNLIILAILCLVKKYYYENFYNNSMLQSKRND
jgi:hypothetical protein